MVDVRAQGTAEQPSPCAGGGDSTVNVRWMLAVIIALSLGIDLFFFNGYYASDDNQYWRGALAILDGQFSPSGPALGEMRLPLTGWNALIITLVGPRIQLVAASYVLFHQLLNLATFVLGARLFSARVGLLAAHLSALTPLLLNFSTVMLPDIPQTLWIVLSFLTFHEAYRWRTRRRDALAGLLLLAAGLCAGLAYATKESGLIALPFYFVLWLVLEWRTALDQQHRRRWRSACGYGALFAAGVAIVFIAETAVLSALNDGMLVRLGWATEDMAIERVERIERVAGLNPLPRAERAYDVLTDDRFLPPTLRGILLLGLVVYPFVRRRPWSLYLFPIWMFAYLTWGTMNLSQYVPPNIKTRYYTIVLPFLFVLASAGVCRLWSTALGRVPLRQARTSLRVLGWAVAAIVPLTWLDAPNGLAGGIYRARFVGPAARAVSRAEHSSSRRIVMSGSVSRLLRTVLGDQRPDRLIDAERVTPKLLRVLAEEGGFEYVEIDEQAFQGQRDRHIRVTTLDTVMHQLIHAGTARLPDDFPWRDVVLMDGKVTAAPAPAFWLGDYLFTVRERMKVQRAATRLEDLWALVGNEVTVPDPARDGFVAIVYRVDAEWASATSAIDQTHAVAAVDLTPTLSRWCIWRTDAYSVQRAADGTTGIDIRVEPGDYAWYVLPKADPQRVLELPAAGCWTGSIDVELAGNVQLELWLRLCDNPALKENVVSNRMTLGPGRNWVRLFVPHQPAFLYPAFRVTGEGQFCVTSFSLTCRDATLQDDQSATTRPASLE